MSNQKAKYLRNLAEHTLNGSLPIESLHELEDEAIIDALTQVKGIGRWSAQMFLMFRLGRLDVLPDLDLGVQKGDSVGLPDAKASQAAESAGNGSEVGAVPDGRVVVHVASVRAAVRQLFGT